MQFALRNWVATIPGEVQAVESRLVWYLFFLVMARNLVSMVLRLRAAVTRTKVHPGEPYSFPYSKKLIVEARLPLFISRVHLLWIKLHS